MSSANFSLASRVELGLRFQLVRGEGANNAIVDVLDLVKRLNLQEDGYLILTDEYGGKTLTPRLTKTRALDSVALSSSIAAYENDVFTRANPSFLNSRQACLDAHDFSKIEGSPLVGMRSLK